MAPIRLGVIGLSANGGWASRDLIPPIFDPLLADKYTLTAICTTSAESAKATAEKYSTLAGGHAVRGYHGEQGQVDLANDPEVDLVVVSVKMPLHYGAVVRAIEAGKKVFVEWAPGRNLEETVRIAEGARAKGVRSMVGLQGVQSVYGRKVKEILDSGKIGRVLSTSLAASGAFFGASTTPSYAYTYDINNGATLLTVLVGHFLAVLKHAVGALTEVSATGAIRIPTAEVLDPATGQIGGSPVANKTSHDQIVLNGILKGRRPEDIGAVVNIHYQGGPSVDEPFRWVIYGEQGTVEVKSTKDAPGFWIATHEKEVYLNGEKVSLEETEADRRLGNTGKGWLEFAKGEEDGVYESLESAVEIYRVVDAALVSIQEGKRIIL